MAHSVHSPTLARAKSLIKAGKTSGASWAKPADADRKQEDCLGSGMTYPIIKGGTLFWDGLRSVIAVANGQQDKGIADAASGLLAMKEGGGKVNMGRLQSRFAIELSRKGSSTNMSRRGVAKIARCPNPGCQSFDVERRPGQPHSGTTDHCKRCGMSWASRNGHLTAEQMHDGGDEPPVMMSTFAKSLNLF